jgi:hypothetical protein
VTAGRAEQRPDVRRAATRRTGNHEPTKYKRDITVDGTLPNRCVAIATRNPALYAVLVGWLREQRIPAVSVFPGDRLPHAVGVVLTSPEEASQIRHARVLPVADEADRTAVLAAIRHALGVGGENDEIVVGFDPGPRPGYSVLAEGRPLAEGVLETPEAAGHLGSLLRHRFPGHSLRFRVGEGDPRSRDRIVSSLAPLRRPVEIVDEHGTTPRGHRRPRDMAAARAIARAPGHVVRGGTPPRVTPGEVTNLQRLSRLGSGGSFTISRSVATQVLRGELTLPDAIAAEENRHRGSSARSPLGEPRGPRPSESSA